jgi:cytoskeletal protein RodZ
MATVGEQLRMARETQNLAVHQVADWTKIRSDHIRALEEGNYSVFSAPVYIRGFVRTYATLLKLDPTVILQQLNQELAGTGQSEPALVPPAGGVMDEAMFQFSKVIRRMALPIVVALVIVIGLLVTYFGWLRYRNKDPLEGVGPGLYQAPPAGETLPLPKPPAQPPAPTQ